MELITAFVVKDPSKLPSGVCTRCGGHSDGWGSGWDGKTTVKLQHAGGEVRNVVCGRCDGTGIEPIGFWAKLKSHFSGEVYP